jgi:colanic acid biosynthesis glycosyl transferase WcaI
VHDYSGHPGQVHLSRELARRGHQVEHQFCVSYTTGRGATERRADDPESFTIRPIQLRNPFARYSPFVRVIQELQYGREATRAVLGEYPDIAVLSNVPLLSLLLLSTALRMRGIHYVFWQQDVYSDAIGVISRRRLGRIGGLVGWLARRCERRIARGASAVVAISDTFIGQLDAWGVRSSAVHVIPNWAAIDEMPPRPRDNGWAESNGLVGVPVVMYAGTLGWKHDPSAIANLAETAPSGTRVVVVSQGLGREWLEAEARDAPGLTLIDYQQYEQLPDMLASADVLLVLLEKDASRYSVPSKVLNYLCAGRPILALLPLENGAARTIEDAGAGIVVAPGDSEAASAALNRLLSDASEREKMGAAARDYAERNFDVVAVGDRFEAVFDQLHIHVPHGRRRIGSLPFTMQSAVEVVESGD